MPTHRNSKGSLLVAISALIATSLIFVPGSQQSVEAKRRHSASSTSSHHASHSAQHHSSGRSAQTSRHSISSRRPHSEARSHSIASSARHRGSHHVAHTTHHHYVRSASYPEPYAENVQNSSSLAGIYRLYDRGVNERLEGHSEQATKILLEAYSSYASAQKNLTIEAMINYELGQAAEASNNYSVAADAYGRTLRIKPNMIEASVRLSSLLMKAGHPELALSRAREAVAMYPNDPRAHEILSLVLDKTGANRDAKSERDSTKSLIKSGSSLNSQPADKGVGSTEQNTSLPSQPDVPSALSPEAGAPAPPKPAGEPVDNDVMQ